MYVYSNGTSKIVLSRYHWNLVTIWTEPVLEDDLPVVDFVDGVHTPIIKTSSNKIGYFELDPNVSALERMATLELYLPAFTEGLRNVKFGKRQSYEHLIVSGNVPSKYLFNLQKMKFAVSIGRLPQPNDVPEVLRKKL